MATRILLSPSLQAVDTLKRFRCPKARGRCPVRVGAAGRHGSVAYVGGDLFIHLAPDPSDFRDKGIQLCFFCGCVRRR